MILTINRINKYYYNCFVKDILVALRNIAVSLLNYTRYYCDDIINYAVIIKNYIAVNKQLHHRIQFNFLIFIFVTFAAI